MDTALLTGFPGFIGRRLASKMLEADEDLKIVALVEERMLGPAEAAATSIDGTRIELLAGNIAEPRLGLTDPEYERIRTSVTKVFHLAAIYDLAVPLEIAQKVNVEGTGNIVDLCAASPSLERFVYVSTAYVAGTRKGIVYEHELVMGQDFKNHYESTKFQAEVWVRESMSAVPTTILRPAIVVGDSRTGETQKFDGPYFILRALAEAERTHRPLPSFGRADAPFNVVPVDFVVAAILAVAADDSAAGQTLHLVDPDPLSAHELTLVLADELGARTPRGRVPAAMVSSALKFDYVRRRFGGTPPESLAYLNHPVKFDTRRTLSLLEPHGLRPPSFSEYAPAMVRFFREHETDRAFVSGARV